MAGDKINARSFAWYQPTGMDNNADPGLTGVITNLLGQLVPGITGAAHGAIASQATNGVIQPGMESFLGTQPNPVPGAPKAYLNWVLLDEEQFKTVDGNYGAVSVQPITGTQEKQLLQSNSGNPIEIKKNGYLYVYVSNESKGNVYFDDIRVDHIHGPLTEETHYYPFGLAMAGIGSKALAFGGPENMYKFNGKELNNKEFSDASGLETYDFGARNYDPQIGRWHKTDNKAELYFATSPYVYALNQPTNAVDPDGNLVIFIQGNHFGEKGHAYWTDKNHFLITQRAGLPTPNGYHLINGHGNGATYGKDRSFDNEVMDQLNDHHTPRYYDGSGGGWHPFFIGRTTNFAFGREEMGYDRGKEDAATIIANLERDKSGNIIETIKIVTHSMGGAYGSGFVRALKEYIRTLPIEQQKQIKITLIADFDPYDASDFTADPNIKTEQFKHKGNGNITGMGWLANEDEKGLDKKNIHTNTGTSTDHTIFSFFNDISSLSEGTYKWDNTQQTWIKQ